jgi:hypothetical protein
MSTIACIFLAAASSPWQGPRVTLSPIALERLADLVRNLVRLPPPPYWTPTREQIDAAETALRTRLEPQYLRYGRQYLGLTIAGRQAVQLRGFCETYYGDQGTAPWERSPVMLLDGADCVFQVDYDPRSSRLGELQWGTPGP